MDPIIFGICNRKNSQFITQGTLQFPCSSWFFPIHGLAVVVKNNFPICGFATHGEIIVSLLLQSLSWGIWECAIRDSWGILFSYIRGFATHIGKIPSLFLSRPGLVQLFDVKMMELTNPSKKYTFWWDWSIHMLLRNIWIDQSICSWESIPAKSAIFTKV